MIIGYYEEFDRKLGVITIGGRRELHEYTSFDSCSLLPNQALPSYAMYHATWLYDTTTGAFLKNKIVGGPTNEELTWALLKAKPYK
jgi:hypothetical protein